jgi:hypothetical protein
MLLLVATIAIDFAVPSEGAFRFNTDESMVGVHAGARSDVPPPRSRLAVSADADRSSEDH